MSNPKGERKETFLTASGLPIDRIYTSQNLPGAHEPDAGVFPYTRGVHGTMYRGKVWTMRQYAGFGTAQEANERYRYLLSRGTTGLSVAFDLPTQMGRDSDHPLSKGEVGRVGVAISTTSDMEVLLRDIPLKDVSISMTINATAGILLGFLLALARKQDVPWSALRGTIQNDVLKEYIARGTYIYPPKSALKITTDIIEFCAKEVPQWNTISISGYHIREAGSTAPQEIAFTLANGIAYVESALARGLDIDAFAPRLAFFFNCHNDFLEEISKFRAARKLWATIMKERFKAKKESSCQLRFHTQTAGSSLTAQQPLNNIVRTTVQAMAAVLGGTQSLHTNSYDEALGLPTEESASIALRTQQILANESGVADVVDPFGGSYLIETWTERLYLQAKEMIDRIDSMGGMLTAIDAGYPQGEIEKAAYDYQRSIESKDRVIVGVNAFGDGSVSAQAGQQIDKKGEQEQCERLAAFRASRDNVAAGVALKALDVAVKEGRNYMPTLVEALIAGITLGEASDCLRAVYGEYRP